MTSTQASNNLSQFFGRHIRVNVDKSENGEDDYTTLEGKVISASDAGLCIRHRGGPVIIDANKIIGEIEEIKRPPRRKIMRRYVRLIDADTPAKQHLADRHGTFVSVLDSVDEDTARLMHDKIDHEDLGHRHGPRGGGNGVEDGAIERLDELDELE
jgi:hypothetical protein